MFEITIKICAVVSGTAGKNVTIVRGGGRVSESYDRNYHKRK